MERKEIKSSIKYAAYDEPIILSKSLIDILLKEENPSALLALYAFYYYTAKWQKTNQPKATVTYVANGLKWGVDKVRLYKNILNKLGLISDICTRNINGQIAAHYIHVNFIWGHEKVSDFTTLGKIPSLVKTEANALSANIPIFSMENLSKAHTNGFITKEHFIRFWNIYPKHTDKGKSKTAWEKLCNKKDRPKWIDIKTAIIAQIDSERWQNEMYIPMPTTWINQNRWLDSPKEMKAFVDYNKQKLEHLHETKKDHTGRKYVWDEQYHDWFSKDGVPFPNGSF